MRDLTGELEEPCLPYSISEHSHRTFYERLETLFAEALALGADVAVCTDGSPLEAKAIVPGSKFPPGRRWTLYHTSRGVPAAS